MSLQAIMGMFGLDKEGVIRELARTGAASEQQFRAMVESGDVESMRRLARKNKDRIRQDARAMKHARYMGANIPEDF